MISNDSTEREARWSKGRPKARNSVSFQPAPSPSTNRPPLISWTAAALHASRPGAANAVHATSGPSRTRSVVATDRGEDAPGVPGPPRLAAIAAVQQVVTDPHRVETHVLAARAIAKCSAHGTCRSTSGSCTPICRPRPAAGPGPMARLPGEGIEEAVDVRRRRCSGPARPARPRRRPARASGRSPRRSSCRSTPRSAARPAAGRCLGPGPRHREPGVGASPAPALAEHGHALDRTQPGVELVAQRLLLNPAERDDPVEHEPGRGPHARELLEREGAELPPFGHRVGGRDELVRVQAGQEGTGRRSTPRRAGRTTCRRSRRRRRRPSPAGRPAGEGWRRRHRRTCGHRRRGRDGRSRRHRGPFL